MRAREAFDLQANGRGRDCFRTRDANMLLRARVHGRMFTAPGALLHYKFSEGVPIPTPR